MGIYYCGHWDMHYGDGMFSVSYLMISLICWDRFSACINVISSRTDPCQFTLSNKLGLGLDRQWTWATLNENSQYFSVAPAALYMMVFTKKKYKCVGKHRFVCNRHYWENGKDPFFWNRDFPYKVQWLKGIFWPKCCALMEHGKVQTTRNQLWSTNVA